MSSTSRVSWNEGMFLRPQHFQQQDRYFSNTQAKLIEHLNAFAWGVYDYSIDEQLFNLGQIGLESINGIFADGTLVQLPECDELPTPIMVPKGCKDEQVYLCLPIDKPTGVNISSEDSSSITRFKYLDHGVVDNTIGGDAYETIQLAKLRTLIKLESEDLSGYVAIPFARIVELTDDGVVRVDKKFIPPLLNVQRNGRLMTLVRETIGMIRQRAEALAARISQGQGRASSIADFLMLQVLNRYEPMFKHYIATSGTHPEALYLQFISFAGELATFTAKEKRAPEFDKYQHDNLTSVFGNVMVALNQTLSVVLEQTALALPLEQTKFGIHVSPLNDKSLLTDAQFVIAVSADLPHEEIRKHLPARIKIGSVEQIRDLVNNQLPGITITSLPVAPRQVPFNAGYHYFQLDKTSDYWPRLANSGGIALHLSGNYPGLKLELWAIKG
ncbi:type VI secretion system baseplate subunit TssK [Litoribrevibacter albus]|uniref:Type VI secretion protein n=1 Tax=Litoribrevibacter albus TaxID=1473156 RepID=A0AA37SB08_9GAMM|nr:type VI secretion system baseplate subunit TssK [Litoribrevibacter albus]GLQ31846.1 type VI secretion protein [Litoribrevibacter albus]